LKISAALAKISPDDEAIFSDHAYGDFFINMAVDHLVSAMVISTSTKVTNSLFTGIRPVHLSK
jgi:hypothetical protein